MTATTEPRSPSGPASRPAHPASDPADGRADARPAGSYHDDSPRHEPTAELCLILVTMAVIVGFGRVFTGINFAGPLVVVAVATHGGLMIARRRRIGLALTSGLAAVGIVVLCGWLFFFDTTRLLIPTPATLDAARAALHSSWSAFQEVVAPTPPQPGFLLAASVGVFFAVFLADWAAFRLWAPIEALVPTLTLFVFTALVGSTRGQVPTMALYLTAALVFVLEHRVAQRERSTTWLVNQVEQGSSWLLRTGVVLVAVAVLAGMVISPNLPGARDPGIISWRGDRAGPSSRVTISPLVDIRTRLVDNGDVELFTVVSPARAYWRLTSLDTFDGQIWKSSGRFASVDGRLPDARASSLSDPGTSGEVEQRFDISALSALWLPAASRPVAIDAPTTRIRFQKETSTLIVDTNVPTSDGQAYTVKSVLPTFTPDQLRGASPEIPRAIADQDLGLPDALSIKVKATALQVAGGATTAYDRAMALQTYFRETGGFVYDLDVPAGHSDSAIDDFLTGRRGYCEQFAGTYAAMARSIGLPARVAVGFTPGITDPSNPERFVVKGEHAHAWPEVYLGDFGWVPFEPTPGRGAPNAESYTRVAESQFEPNGARPTTTSTTLASSSSTAPGGLPAGGDRNGEQRVASAGGGDGSNRALWPRRLAAGAMTLLVLAALYLVVVPSTLAWRRRRRRARALDASARVQVAWLESEEALAAAGQVRQPAETSREFAWRAGGQLPGERAGLVTLADSADAALFSSTTLDEPQAERAEQTTTLVRAAVARSVPWWRRALRQVDGRRLLPRSSR
jgi:transglutaminase-like putative cysteine protease